MVEDIETLRVKLVGDQSGLQKMYEEALANADKAVKQVQGSAADAERAFANSFGKSLDAMGNRLKQAAEELKVQKAILDGTMTKEEYQGKRDKDQAWERRSSIILKGGSAAQADLYEQQLQQERALAKEKEDLAKIAERRDYSTKFESGLAEKTKQLNAEAVELSRQKQILEGTLSKEGAQAQRVQEKNAAQRTVEMGKGATSSQVDELERLQAKEREMVRQKEQLAEAEKVKNRHMEEGKKITQDNLTNEERRAQTLADLEAKLKLGAITQETFNRATRNLPPVDPLQAYGAQLSEIAGVATITAGVVTGAFGSMMYQALAAAAKFEQTTVAFSTMMGSTEKATDLLGRFTEFAAATPYSMPEIEQVGRGLIMFGEDSNSLMNTLKMLGDTAAGTASSFNMIGMIYNQIRGVGHLLTGDFRQLASRGVISLQDIAKHYKTTTAGAQEMVSRGKISFEEFRTIMMGLTSEGGRFSDMMKKQSETASGLKSTFEDSVGIAFRQVGEELIPVQKLLYKFGIELTAVFGNMDPVAKKAIAGFLGISTVVAGTVASLAGLSFTVIKLGGAWAGLIKFLTEAAGTASGVIATSGPQTAANLAVAGSAQFAASANQKLALSNIAVSGSSKLAAGALKAMALSKWALVAGLKALVPLAAGYATFKVADWFYEATEGAKQLKRELADIDFWRSENLNRFKFEVSLEVDTKKLDKQMEDERKNIADRTRYKQDWEGMSMFNPFGYTAAGKTAKDQNEKELVAAQDRLKALQDRRDKVVDLIPVADRQKLYQEAKEKEDTAVAMIEQLRKKIADRSTAAGKGNRLNFLDFTGLVNRGMSAVGLDTLAGNKEMNLAKQQIPELEKAKKSLEDSLAGLREDRQQKQLNVAVPGLEGRTDQDIANAVIEMKTKKLPAMNDELKLQRLLREEAQRQGIAVKDLLPWEKERIRLLEVEGVGKRMGKLDENKADLAAQREYTRAMQDQAAEAARTKIDQTLEKQLTPAEKLRKEYDELARSLRGAADEQAQLDRWAKATQKTLEDSLDPLKEVRQAIDRIREQANAGGRLNPELFNRGIQSEMDKVGGGKSPGKAIAEQFAKLERLRQSAPGSDPEVYARNKQKIIESINAGINPLRAYQDAMEKIAAAEKAGVDKGAIDQLRQLAEEARPDPIRDLRRELEQLNMTERERILYKERLKIANQQLSKTEQEQLDLMLRQKKAMEIEQKHDFRGNYVKQVRELNEAFGTGKMSQEAYDKEMKEINKTFAEAREKDLSLQAQVSIEGIEEVRGGTKEFYKILRDAQTFLNSEGVLQAEAEKLRGGAQARGLGLPGVGPTAAAQAGAPSPVAANAAIPGVTEEPGTAKDMTDLLTRIAEGIDRMSENPLFQFVRAGLGL